MPDFRAYARRRAELIAHIRAREGLIRHLYADSRGWITVGIGELIDRQNAALGARQNAARQWFRSHNIEFRHRATGDRANVDQFIEDWNRAQAFYAAGGPAPARAYGPRTHYRINERAAQQMLGAKIDGFADQLYRLRPFMLNFDERVAMAIVDARYNPAGVALYDMHDDPGDNFHPDIPRFWASLNPNRPPLEYQTAIDLFRSIWANRGNAVYRQRHQIRLQWFTDGINAMRAQERSEFDTLISELAEGRI